VREWRPKAADSFSNGDEQRGESNLAPLTRRRSTNLSETGGGSTRHDFPPKDRVRTKAEIDKVFASGARFSCKGMRLHVLATGKQMNRAVFIPVRSYPNAVSRNRAKRILRECWRHAKGAFVKKGYDCIVVVYPGADKLRERRAQLERLLLQAGITGGQQ